MRKLFILIPLLIVSCSTEEPSEENYSQKIEDFHLEYWGDVRKDFSCGSYKALKDITDFDGEDNTSFKVKYSLNLGKRLVWLNDELLDDNALYDFDDETVFSIDDTEGGVSFTFYEQTYQLDVNYLGVDNADFYEIRFHCLPI